jgi:hypothetical protein
MRIKEEELVKPTAWSEEIKRKVWKKGLPIKNYDSSIWRMDKFGLLMNYAHFENFRSDTCWEIGLVISLEKGGVVELANFLPKNVRSE